MLFLPTMRALQDHCKLAKVTIIADMTGDDPDQKLGVEVIAAIVDAVVWESAPRMPSEPPVMECHVMALTKVYPARSRGSGLPKSGGSFQPRVQHSERECRTVSRTRQNHSRHRNARPPPAHSRVMCRRFAQPCRKIIPTKQCAHSWRWARQVTVCPVVASLRCFAFRERLVAIPSSNCESCHHRPLCRRAWPQSSITVVVPGTHP